MKDITKYKHTRTAIKVNSEEEYEALVPLLNTIFEGWISGKWNCYKDGYDHFYVHLDSDSVSRHTNDLEVIETEEFLTGEPEVINNYEIY